MRDYIDLIEYYARAEDIEGRVVEHTSEDHVLQELQPICVVYLADNGLVNDCDRLVELRGLDEEIAVIRFVVGELGIVYTKGET